MNFTSFEFLSFFSIVVFLTLVLPSRYKWMLWLAASFYFYGSLNVYFLLLLVGSTLVDYFLCLKMRQGERGPIKGYMIAGLLNNIITLFVFKYLYFFTKSANSLLGEFSVDFQFPLVKIILPIGVSYFTFKKISYIVDVYREKLKPEKHLGKFMLYTSFFPSLLAGPIDRPSDLLTQFHKETTFDFDRMVEGGVQVLWGFFKKLVIADNLAQLVAKVFNHPQKYDGLFLLIAVLSFTIQIYCDFSGYSDIAIGAAKILGIKLTDNFNRPYFAVSITDFWRRWHISLSSWLRDYLFLPISFSVSRKIKSPKLLGMKTENYAYLFGMTATMLLCGLWHGANWTFILWGGIHGLYMGLAFITRKKRAKLRKWIGIKKNSSFHRIAGISITISFITLSWVFFRANSIPDAWYILTHLFSGIPQLFQVLYRFVTNFKLNSFADFLIAKDFGVTYFQLLLVVVSVIFMTFVEIKQKEELNVTGAVRNRPIVIRWAFYYLVIFWILILTKGNSKDFIYFQF